MPRALVERLETIDATYLARTIVWGAVVLSDFARAETVIAVVKSKALS